MNMFNDDYDLYIDHMDFINEEIRTLQDYEKHVIDEELIDEIVKSLQEETK